MFALAHSAWNTAPRCAPIGYSRDSWHIADTSVRGTSYSLELIWPHLCGRATVWEFVLCLLNWAWHKQREIEARETGVRALALHVDNSGSNTGIAYPPLGTRRINYWGQSSQEQISPKYYQVWLSQKTKTNKRKEVSETQRYIITLLANGEAETLPTFSAIHKNLGTGSANYFCKGSDL